MLFAGMISAFTIISSVGAGLAAARPAAAAGRRDRAQHRRRCWSRASCSTSRSASFAREPRARAAAAARGDAARRLLRACSRASSGCALIRQGLTLTSSTLGRFFYLIVGLHALHAVVALGVLAYTWLRLQRGWLAQSQLAAAQVFWYFVVGLWPVLYAVVYL